MAIASKHSGAILLDHPGMNFSLRLSYLFQLLSNLSGRINELNTEELDLLQYISQEIREHARTIFIIPSQPDATVSESKETLSVKKDEFLRALALKSQHNASTTIFSYLNQMIATKILENSRNNLTSRQLIITQKNLFSIFHLLVKQDRLVVTTKEIIAPLPQLESTFSSIIKLSQEIVQATTVKKVIQSVFDCLCALSLLTECAEYEFCLQMIDLETIHNKLESLLLELNDSALLSTLEESPSLISRLLQRKIILITKKLTGLLARVLLENNASEAKESPHTNTDALQTRIFESKLFQQLEASKLYQKSELLYCSVRLYLVLQFHVSCRRMGTQKLEQDTIFMNFFLEFIKQPFEKLSELQIILESCRDQELQREYLIQRKLLETALKTSLSGKSNMVQQVNLTQFLQALNEKFFIGDEATVRASKTSLIEAIVEAHASFVANIQKRYNDIMELDLKTQGNDQAKVAYAAAMRDLLNQKPILDALAEIYTNFLYRSQEFHSNKPLAEEARHILVSWLNHPVMVLFGDTSYKKLLLSTLFEINTYTKVDKGYLAHFKGFIRMQEAISWLNLNTPDILQGQNIIELCEAKDSFKTSLFDIHASAESLQIAHYLENIFVHPLLFHNPWEYIENLEVGKILGNFKNFCDEVNITPESFILAGIRFFLKLAEKYFEARVIQMKKADCPEDIYPAIQSSFFNSKFFEKMADFIWNSLHLVYFSTQGSFDFTALDKISLIGELVPITPEDFNDKFTLSVKVSGTM